MKKIIIIFMNFIFCCFYINAELNYEQGKLIKLTMNEQSVQTNQQDELENEDIIYDNNEPLLFIDSWARPSVSSNSAVYLNIRNKSDNNYVLTSASAISVANNVEIHQSYMDEKGISRMTSVDKILIPANTEIILKPGGMHIMLFDLKRNLNPGDKFKLSLSFENLTTKTIDVIVNNQNT